MKRPMRLANTAGWAGDRSDAMFRQASTDPTPDVLVGDYLSEITIGWAARQRYEDQLSAAADATTNPEYSRDKGRDWYFVKTILPAFEQSIDVIVEKGIKLVTNAGSLSPRGCAKALGAIAEKKGYHDRVKVAWVEGDDLLGRVDELKGLGLMRDFESGEIICDGRGEANGNGGYGKAPTSKEKVWCGVNAYIGGWGVVEALKQGADIVVTGRTTDASSVVAACAWWHDWGKMEYDRLAQAVLCGHILECSMYVTGGNFSGFKQLGENFIDLAFPVAEMEEDGAFVITKTEKENGIVTVQTVTAQMLYEIQGNLYVNPDVQVDFQGIALEQQGKDRVQVKGAKGFPPPETAKCATYAVGGYQAEAFAFATGLDYKRKFEMFENLARHWLSTQPKVNLTSLVFQHIGRPAEDPKSELEATATLRIFAQAERAEDFPPNGLQALVEGLSMGTYPGFHRALDMRSSLPKLYMDFWPSTVPESSLQLEVGFLDGKKIPIPSHEETIPAMQSLSYDSRQPYEPSKWGPVALEPLGSIVMGRSGDKGGNVNIGLYVRHEDEYEWLQSFLSMERFHQLLGDEDQLIHTLERVEFPGLLAVHFLCKGLLGEGVSNTDRLDGLAKSMNEFIRARMVELPQTFLDRGRI